MIIKKYTCVVILTLAWFSCSKEDVQIPAQVVEDDLVERNLSIELQMIDGSGNMIPDSLYLVNDSGNIYSVEKYQILLGNLTLDYDGELISLNEKLLLDMSDPSPQTFTFKHPRDKHHAGIHLSLGMPDVDNKPGKYPEFDQAGMGVEDPKYGGYFYMKIEGKYRRDVNDPSPKPYRIHQSNMLAYYMSFHGQVVDTLFSYFGMNVGLFEPKIHYDESQTNAHIAIEFDVSKIFNGQGPYAQYGGINIHTFPYSTGLLQAAQTPYRRNVPYCFSYKVLSE